MSEATAGLRFATYESIGVRPLINCKGTYTIISGSLMLPEARAAMYEASRRYVHMDELSEAVGRRIAEVMQCEWGLIVNGCAAALTQLTAACVAGTDPEKMARLPDTEGMQNEVLVQPSHRHMYDHAVRMVGTRLIEVRTAAELGAAFSDRTALCLVFGDAAERGEITVADMARMGHDHGVPTIVDAAAERPDVPNPYLADGVDAVCYSGGKCLRGPQSAGLILGRKELLQAAFLNGAPHHALGRPMKAAKEEVMGLLAAVEQWVERDHDAEWREWERRLQVVEDSVSGIDTVSCARRQPGRSNVSPVSTISWDSERLGVTPEGAARALAEGEPRVEMFTHASGVSVMPYMMEPGDEQMVARRLPQVLRAAQAEGQAQ